MKYMYEKVIDIKKRPDIIEVKAILTNGEEKIVSQLKLGNGDPSQCIAFDKFYLGDFEIQLRLDWKDVDENGDPKLDADIWNENGHKYKIDRNIWHHTNKQLIDAVWIYEWKFKDFTFLFRLGITSNRNITGVARIVKS